MGPQGEFNVSLTIFRAADSFQLVHELSAPGKGFMRRDQTLRHPAIETHRRKYRPATGEGDRTSFYSRSVGEGGESFFFLLKTPADCVQYRGSYWQVIVSRACGGWWRQQRQGDVGVDIGGQRRGDIGVDIGRQRQGDVGGNCVKDSSGGIGLHVHSQL